MNIDPSILLGQGVLSISEGPKPTVEATRTTLTGTPELLERVRSEDGPRTGAGWWQFVLTFPCKVVSEANSRDHWTARRKRFADQAESLFQAWPWILTMGNFSRWHRELPLTITFIRTGRRMDSDNLAGAFKGLRDELARLIGIDDGDPRITWHYDQMMRMAGGVAEVQVRIEKRPA